jgi:hypothetical protein
MHCTILIVILFAYTIDHVELKAKRRVLRLESRSYSKSHHSPEAYYFSEIVGQELFLVVSKPCLTFLSSVANRSLSPKCTPWFASIIKSYRCGVVSTCF